MKEACFIAASREYPTSMAARTLGRREFMDEIIAQDLPIATDRIDDIFVGLDPRRRNITIRGSMKDVSS
jgi:hypothetical protein